MEFHKEFRGMFLKKEIKLQKQIKKFNELEEDIQSYKIPMRYYTPDSK